MIKTGSKVLDEFLKGYKQEISCIYGPAATGKTTMCLLAAVELAKNDKKVVFIDTENGFNVDRIRQIAGWNYIGILDKILLIKIRDFEDQCKKVENLLRFIDIDLVIIDSINNFYRKEIHENVKDVNNKLIEQMRILNKLTRKGVHVVLTSQVLNKFDQEKVCFVGGKIIENHSTRIMELQKDPRKIILEKPGSGEFNFSIVDEGVISA